MLLLAALPLALTLSQATPALGLEAGFRNPPATAKPHTWWHWMDGNVTKAGITADLEAMKEVGIGGAQMFTVAQDIPKGPVDYMGPLWREMTKHAISEADRLGIELCLHNCAGWSSSGGPWVKPEHAMQVLAWSEVKVQGPRTLTTILPKIKAPQVYAQVDYSRDIAVYAFRSPVLDDPRKPDFLGKTGVNRQDGLIPDFSPAPNGVAIPKGGLIDLTSRMDADGKLIWDVPEGSWTILRLGHVPTGKDNHPAPPEGDGLEVDKLSREALDAFWMGTMQTVLDDNRALAGKSFNNALVDSYEVGGQNWTPKFREDFKRLRGYDCFPYLPAITGAIIDDRETTERFLWDFRRTIADLFSANYYDYFAELCRKNGLLFSTEPYGNGGFDNLEAGRSADIPMGEFWLGGGTLETTKIASSTGHVYGRQIIGAESFTASERQGAFLEEPFAAKALGDLVFTNGVNRYIFHRYAHQPWTNKFPGMTMGPWGTHLERTQTWWTEAQEWMKYIARCQFMLQQGKFYADVLYYYGEGAPVDLPYRPNLNPRIPEGYDYDGIAASALLRCTIENGRIVAPGGVRYRVLVLPNSEFMTPAVARKIESLVRGGAIVLGPQPKLSPSLTNRDAWNAEVVAIGKRLWANAGPDGAKIGSGRVYTGTDLAAVLAKSTPGPDFSYISKSGGSNLAYIHRQIGGAHSYFVSNQAYRATEVECRFRIGQFAPELWHADTGKIEPAPIWRREGSSTVVTLRLDPAESVFVVFANPQKPHLASLSMQNQVAAPVKPPPAVKIVKARYEADAERGADVTSVVADMVRKGQFEIPATNSVFGDPIVNVVKRLVIEYTVDGKPMRKVAGENESIVLAEVAGPKAPLTHTIESSANGLSLTAFKAGTFVGKTPDGKSVTVRAEAPRELDLSNSWNVTFEPNWGAPKGVVLFQKLISWPESKNEGIKYFSGSAVYKKSFKVNKAMMGAGRAVFLDLGRVKNFATVTLNGKAMPAMWKEPFRMDLTGKLREGGNHLEVKVTNLWVNRIIGDEQLPADAEWVGTHLKGWPAWLGWPNSTTDPSADLKSKRTTGRYTFSTWKYWSKDSPLLESGLIGPVKLISAQNVAVK